MALDQTTKVTYRRKPSFLERLGRSCSGILIGLCLFLFSFIILYYNEGNAVDTTSVLDDGLKEVIPLDISIKQRLNHRLVHHTGILETAKDIVDPVYDFAVRCVKLHRKVEIYQWMERSHVQDIDEGDKIRHETTFTYTTDWSSSLSNSRNFYEELGHQNPREIYITDKVLEADSVYVDNIRLSSSLVGKISWFELLESLPPPNKGIDISLHHHYYYHGKNPSIPEVGDVRVSFQCAGKSASFGNMLQDVVSVVAMLDHVSFAPFKTNNGKSIEFLYRGSKSAEDIFNSEHASNNARTWIFRGFGVVLMYVGLSIMSRIIVTLVDWIPFVRDTVATSVTLFNLTLALFLSLITIALAWLRFRPLFATSVVALSFLPWYLSRFLKAKATYYRR